MTSKKMNKHKMIWGVLLASLLGLFLGGCSKELGRGGNEEVPGVPGEGETVTFALTTGVETYAVPAQDYEKSISSLQAILFDANGAFAGDFVPVKSGTRYSINVPKSGNFTMFLVANHTLTAGQLAGKTLPDVRKILVTKNPGQPDHFVMSSSNPATFTVTPGTVADAGTINLERLAARIDVQTGLSKLTLSKITVLNRKVQSEISAATSTDSYNAENEVYSSLKNFKDPSTTASRGQIYSYENSTASASGTKGTSLLVEASYAGVGVKPLEVKLPALKRNYIYSVQIVMGDEGFKPNPGVTPDPSKLKLTYNVKVVDWNKGETFVISEEDLLKMFQAGAVSYGYGVNYTTNPNIASGVGAQGGTVSVIATATKQKLVSGVPDPTAPVETINGADKFGYSILATPTAPDWLTVSPAGVLTVRENTTGVARTAIVQISVRENPSTTAYLTVMQLATPAAPTTTSEYRLVSVTPATLSYEAKGGTQTLSLAGTVIEKQNGTPVNTRALAFSDVTVEKSAGADWLTIAGGAVIAAENTTTAARQATVTVRVTADPSQVKTVTVTQAAGGTVTPPSGRVYTLTSVTPTSIDFETMGGRKQLTIDGSVTERQNGQLIFSKPLKLDDVTIDTGGAGWLTVTDGVVTAVANTSTDARQAVLTVRVNADPSLFKTVAVSQKGRTIVSVTNNPLAYVALYNVTRDAKWDLNYTMPTTSQEKEKLLMDWSFATNRFGIDLYIEGSTQTYRLPTLDAWRSVIPQKEMKFGATNAADYHVTETVVLAGQRFDATGDYKPSTLLINGERVNCNVALRYNGTGVFEKQYRSAWLYYWGALEVGGKAINGLWVYCLNIADRTGITAVEYLDQTFWDQNRSSAVVRFFPAAGLSNGNQGGIGSYWSATSGSYVYHMSFESNSFNVSTRNDGPHYYDPAISRSVRLFASTPIN